jgi:hypothetical protein
VNQTAELFPSPPRAGGDRFDDMRKSPVTRMRRRVLMHFTDVGYIDGLGQAATFACKRCGFKSDWQGASDTEIRRGVPCPSCNDRGETCLG